VPRIIIAKHRALALIAPAVHLLAASLALVPVVAHLPVRGLRTYFRFSSFFLFIPQTLAPPLTTLWLAYVKGASR
jgi:hypothetical protein